MSHQVLSRKYRPQGFDELVGQEHVARILRNALKSGRVGHAYLFVGPRGVGKTTSARILAKAINCSKRGEKSGAKSGEASVDPCGKCVSCVGITAGSDLDVVEIDAASNNAVDDVRALREQVGYAPVRSPFRIWIVDEVHMLSLPAFNAFLKTLEEPPAHVKFLFCTTEEHKLPTTFRSRCQVVEFRPITPAAMTERLAALAAREGAEVEGDVLQRIAAGALGGLRDAESLLEQLLAAREGPRVTVADYDALSGRAPEERLAALRDAIRGGDAAAALAALDACLAGSAKPGVLADQWLESARQDLVSAAKQGDGGALARASRALDVLLAKRAHLKAGADGTLVLEAAAVELARLPHARDLDRLIEALRDAGGGARGGAPAGGQPPQRAPGRIEPGPAASRPHAGSSGAPRVSLAEVPGPATRLPGPPERANESAAAPGAAPAALASAAPADVALPHVDLVRARWDAFVEVGGRRDVRLRDALRRAQVLGVAEGRLRLGLARSDAMARATLERREMLQAFRQAAREVFGAELAPSVEVSVEAGPTPRADATLREHPDVRRVAEATGGRVLSVERDAGPASPPPSAG